MNHLSSRVELLLAVLGVVLLGGWGSGVWMSHRFQTSEDRNLEEARARTQPSHAGSREPATSQHAEPARIEIPRLNLRAIIAEGTTDRILDRAVGHLRLTARPGDPGNCVLAGHRDTFFRSLNGIRVGDIIHLTTPDGQWSYRVTNCAVVSPRRTDILRATASPTLTLVTCYPFELIGPAPMRFIVQAERVDPQPRPQSGAAG